MKRMASLSIVATAILIGAFLAQGVHAASNGKEAFDQLKTLVGHWEAVTPDGTKGSDEIALTSGGSAIIERFTMAQGDKHEEMVTMYYLDGEQLKLTHYCEAGNQPTMVATYAPETKTLTFNFVSATNLKSSGDGHMHHAVYTFVDNDHFKTAWTFRKDQKDVTTEEGTYVRK